MKEAISLSISYVFFLIIKDVQKWDVCIESNINTSSEGQNIHRSTHGSSEQNSHADQFEELIITPTNATLSSLGAAESSIISGVNRRSKNLFEWRPHLPWTSSAYNDYAMSFVHAVADGTSWNRVNSLTIRWPPNHFEGRHIWPWMLKSNVELFFSQLFANISPSLFFVLHELSVFSRETWKLFHFLNPTSFFISSWISMRRELWTVKRWRGIKSNVWQKNCLIECVCVFASEWLLMEWCGQHPLLPRGRSPDCVCGLSGQTGVITCLYPSFGFGVGQLNDHNLNNDNYFAQLFMIP